MQYPFYSVVCRELGYRGGTARSSATYGQGSGSIIYDNMQCTGSELTLSSCAGNSPMSHNCGHYEDASVDCLPPLNPGPSQQSTLINTVNQNRVCGSQAREFKIFTFVP